MNTIQVLVRKNDLSDTRLRQLQDSELAAGQVQVRIDAFALTSNNITYAAFGEAMNYWQFFPTGEDGWGMIPVWGFGEVVRTSHPELALGERLYGYYPMASSVLLTPARVKASGFSDAAAHRAALHSVYNQYLRSAADPFYTQQTEDIQALLRPLFITSWLIDDFLADNDFFGASTLLLSSASSKTAYGTAFQLSQRQGIDVIGLTSAANKAFCESLGCYSRVLSYDELDRVAPDSASVFVDFAGNADLRRAIHARFANLKYSCSIGGTHVQQLGSAKDLPGPRPTLFFAPAQVSKRIADWGAGEFTARMVQAWRNFCAQVGSGDPSWVTLQRSRGSDAALSAYARVLAGRGDPRIGHILSLLQ
ncbi:MAG: DUF2855 family protein [Rhodoferax sp.]